MQARDLAVALVRAFGQPDRIAELLDEDATWWITPAIPDRVMQSTTTGKQEIHRTMTRVFGEVYDPATVEVEIHDAFGEGDLGAVRFTYRAVIRDGAISYQNEYAVFIRRRGNQIINVYEYLDLAHLRAQQALAQQ